MDLRLSQPNDIARVSGWDLDFRQIEPGEMETRVVVRPSPDVSLLELHMDRSVHQLGCSPKGAVTFGLPLPSAIRSWRGSKTESFELLFFGTGIEFEGVSGSSFAGLTVSVSEPFFTRVADRIGLPLQDHLQGQHALPLRQDTAACDRLLEAGQGYLYDGETRFGTAEQEDFVAGLISASAGGEAFADRSAYSTRAAAVRRALDYMREGAGEGISIADICEASRVSWRTLDRSFRDAFGIGPKAYLNRYRLGQVRLDLLRAGADTAVADVANAWGFWHMGQFAKDYRQMFGELPSETLRGARAA